MYKRPTLIPYLFVAEAERAIEFYKRCFGFELIKVTKDASELIIHAEMVFNHGMIMFAQEGACGETTKTPHHQKITCPISLYVYCEDPDKLYKHALIGGAKNRMAPKNMFWGERTCELEDLDGYQWTFAAPISQASCESTKELSP